MYKTVLVALLVVGIVGLIMCVGFSISSYNDGFQNFPLFYTLLVVALMPFGLIIASVVLKREGILKEDDTKEQIAELKGMISNLQSGIPVSEKTGFYKKEAVDAMIKKHVMGINQLEARNMVEEAQNE